MPTTGDKKSHRITGTRLQKIRARHFRLHPLCVHCLARVPPRIRAATELDHIVPLIHGGLDTEANRQGLCRDCHDIKTRADMGWREKTKTGIDGWPVKR